MPIDISSKKLPLQIFSISLQMIFYICSLLESISTRDTQEI